MTTLIDSATTAGIFEEGAEGSLWSRILGVLGGIGDKTLDYLTEDFGALDDDEYVHMSAWYSW